MQPAATSKTGNVRLFNLDDGRAVSTFLAHSLAALAVGFFPDGQRLVTGGFNGEVKLWRLPDGKLFDTLEGHTGDVRLVVVSPDGKTLATGSDDQTVKIWDTATCRVQATFPFPHGNDAFIQSGAFSSDGKRFDHFRHSPAISILGNE